MKIERTNMECQLRDTDICNYTGSEGCETCYLGTLGSKSDFIQIQENWKATLNLVPDRIDEVHQSEDCWFCRGDRKNKAERYALAELANREPAYKKGYFWGVGPKIRMDIGSLLVIPVPCCKKCEKNLKTYLRMRWGIRIGGIFLGVAAFIVLALVQEVTNAWIGIPYIVAALLMAAGVIAGPILAKSFKKKKEAVTAMNLFETPILSEMRQRGWFAMQEDKGEPRVQFVKKKPRPNMVIKKQESIDTQAD